MSRPRRRPIPSTMSPGREFSPDEFVARHVVRDDAYETPNGELMSSYLAACRATGLLPASHRRLSQAMKRAGFAQGFGRTDGRLWPCALLVDIPG